MTCGYTYPGVLKYHEHGKIAIINKLLGKTVAKMTLTMDEKTPLIRHDANWQTTIKNTTITHIVRSLTTRTRHTNKTETRNTTDKIRNTE